MKHVQYQNILRSLKVLLQCQELDTMRSGPLKNIVRQQWATQHLPALLQKMVDFKEKKAFVNDNHFESLLALKCQSLFSFTFFFFIFLFRRKPHFAKQCSLLQRPLHLTYCGLKHSSSSIKRRENLNENSPTTSCHDFAV